MFPNTVLTYTQDHCGIFTSFPISPEQSVLHFSVLVHPEEKAKKPESYWEANRNLFARRWSRISASARPSSATATPAPTGSRPSASSRRRWAGTTQR